jgi:branched-subunit amino acid transport protein
MRKVLSVISAFFVETVSLPTLARGIGKIVSSFFGFLLSSAKAILFAVLADPLMFILIGGILLYAYLKDFISSV